MSDEPSGECPPEWTDYYETRLNNSSNEFLTRLQHANAELAALRAEIARLREEAKDWAALVLEAHHVEIAALRAEMRRLREQIADSERCDFHDDPDTDSCEDCEATRVRARRALKGDEE